MTELDFQVLCVAPRAVVIPASAWGRFGVLAVATLAEAAQALQGRGCDALVIETSATLSLHEVRAWPALAHAVLDAAVVIVDAGVDGAAATAADAGAAIELLALGVQDVLRSVDQDADGLGLARVLRQAVERKRLERAARKAYATDLATGLPNHTQLLEHMTHLVALRAREPAPMALIVLRIEGLNATQAALGVEAANVLKRKVAVRLRSALRASDVVASLGVDTFAVLLAWLDAHDAGERVARKLAHSLTQPFSVTGRELHVGVRVGLAAFPQHGEQAEDLLRRALGQAAQMATLGGEAGASPAQAIDRGPSAAANDEA